MKKILVLFATVVVMMMVTGCESPVNVNVPVNEPPVVEPTSEPEKQPEPEIQKSEEELWLEEGYLNCGMVLAESVESLKELISEYANFLDYKISKVQKCEHTFFDGACVDIDVVYIYAKLCTIEEIRTPTRVERQTFYFSIILTKKYGIAKFAYNAYYVDKLYGYN